MSEKENKCKSRKKYILNTHIGNAYIDFRIHRLFCIGTIQHEFALLAICRECHPSFCCCHCNCSRYALHSHSDRKTYIRTMLIHIHIYRTSHTCIQPTWASRGKKYRLTVNTESIGVRATMNSSAWMFHKRDVLNSLKTDPIAITDWIEYWIMRFILLINFYEWLRMIIIIHWFTLHINCATKTTIILKKNIIQINFLIFQKMKSKPFLSFFQFLFLFYLHVYQWLRSMLCRSYLNKLRKVCWFS